MRTIFLDSNILLHYKIFTDIDWIKVSEDSRCKIVIAPIVIEELDKIKIGNNTISKRARTILTRIENIIEYQNTEIRKHVDFEVILSRPNDETFKLNRLDFKKQDDQLLASIIEYREQHPGDLIYLCSSDIGPRLRSPQYGIKIIKLSEDLKLPSQEGEVERHIKELQRENALLKSRIPRPILLFEGEQEFIRIKLDKKNIDHAQFIQQNMDEVKNQYPYMVYTENSNDSPFAIIASLTQVAKDQIEGYNSDLNVFYTRYAAYLQELYEYELKSSLSIRINLILTNKGNTPAENVDVYCHFPDGFELFNEDDLDDPPNKPIPPSTPKTMLAGLGNFNVRPYIPDLSRPYLPNINRPSIRKTNSYDVHFYREYVKHHTLYALDTLVTIYIDYESIKNFSIDYTIIAGNVQEPVTGKLNILYE